MFFKFAFKLAANMTKKGERWVSMVRSNDLTHAIAEEFVNKGDAFKRRRDSERLVRGGNIFAGEGFSFRTTGSIANHNVESIENRLYIMR